MKVPQELQESDITRQVAFCCHFMCRCLAGHHPSIVGVPHTRSNASASDRTGTTLSCGATHASASLPSIVLFSGTLCWRIALHGHGWKGSAFKKGLTAFPPPAPTAGMRSSPRSEEHTSELQ